MKKQLALGTLGIGFLGALYFFFSAPPRLREKKVIEDMGDDEMRIALFTIEDKFLANYKCRPDEISGSDDERDAAKVAGWVEPICKTDPTTVKITEAGRKASVRWRSQDSDSENTTHRWDLTLGRYERTGPPIIREGASPEEKIVTLPGHWIPNEDGKTLMGAGYKPLAAVDRQVTFTYWKGVWSHHHLGD